jgi:hypothetical protein
MAAAEADPVSGGIHHTAIDINSLSRNIQLVPGNVLLDICKTGTLKDLVQNCENEQ